MIAYKELNGQHKAPVLIVILKEITRWTRQGRGSFKATGIEGCQRDHPIPLYPRLKAGTRSPGWSFLNSTSSQIWCKVPEMIDEKVFLQGYETLEKLALLWDTRVNVVFSDTPFPLCTYFKDILLIKEGLIFYKPIKPLHEIHNRCCPGERAPSYTNTKIIATQTNVYLQNSQPHSSLKFRVKWPFWCKPKTSITLYFSKI